MQIKKLFLLSFLALVAYGCQDDKDVKPVPTPGEEVRFGASLDLNALTRTIYGDEVNHKFPIYWVNGDEVLVSSPQCAAARNTATYSVSVGDDALQDYATSLDKTGEYGVQWGDSETADFYSIYPAGDVTVNGTKFYLTMPNVQRDLLTGTSAQADMNACFMSARTAGVANGSTVDLRYQPLSTAIRFKLQGPSEAGQGGEVYKDEVIVSKIVLHAPSGTAIAGDFIADLAGEKPSITLGTNVYNEVTIYSYDASNNSYLALRTGESVELNAFIIPQENLSIDSNWYIQVSLSDGYTFKKYLGGTATDGKSMTLQARQIHRLPDLPNLNVLATEVWDPAVWMVNIPRNVYLSEVSIPGSWNSLNSDCQSSSTDIATQYSKGARAFHIDTRWKTNTTASGWLTKYVLSNTVTELAVANGADSYDVRESTIGSNNGKAMNKDVPTFAETLATITSQVKDDEYMVVLCTFAQNSYNKADTTWMAAVSATCAANDRVLDARTITANTVVGEVLGKVIVIVNCESAVADLTLPGDSKCFFTYSPLTLSESHFATGYYNKDQLYFGTKTASDITLYDTQAQVTYNVDGESGTTITDRGYGPTLTQRKNTAKEILSWSMNNYADIGNYGHNAWIYLGLGGYTCSSSGSSENYDAVASSLNTEIQSIVNNMASRPTGTQTNYFPVGIVLMNQVTNYPEVLNDILQLNNKYHKAYNPDYQEPSGSSAVESAAPGYSSGVEDNNIDAIGWTRVR